MLREQYPAIGTKVSFIRVNALQAPEQGHGVILGITLDPNKRLMAHIDTGQEKVNVHFESLNPTGIYIEKFASGIKQIKEISDEGNKLVKEIVEKYNKKVDDIYADLFGEPVVFEAETSQNNDDSVSQ